VDSHLVNGVIFVRLLNGCDSPPLLFLQTGRSQSCTHAPGDAALSAAGVGVMANYIVML